MDARSVSPQQLDRTDSDSEMSHMDSANYERVSVVKYKGDNYVYIASIRSDKHNMKLSPLEYDHLLTLLI